MNEPTQPPWKACGREIVTDTPGQLLPYIVAQCGVYTLTNTDREGIPEANAELICRAVNAHAELVAALTQFVHMDDQDTEIGGGQWNAAVVMARAALAKAKGEQS